MSFILDALRKSEHERQRSAVPGLAHVPLATAPPPLPRWALLAIATLAVAVLVLAAAWWQSTRTVAGTSAAAPAATLQRSVALPLPSAAPPAAAPVVPRLGAVERSPVTRPLADASSTVEPSAAPLATAAAPPAPAPASRPADDAPALPSAAALAAQGVALPPLRLELHAFSARPSDRFVFINGRKYVEGDRLPEGPEIVAITPAGAVLSQYGQRFLLTPE